MKRLTLAAIAAWTAACVVAVGGLLDESYPADVGRYADFGRAMADGELPYRDFYTEYPPLALVLFLLPALVSSEHYHLVFELGVVLAGLVTIAALAAVLHALDASTRRSAVALAVVAVLPLTLGHVVLNRYDIWPAALSVLALLVVLRRRAVAAGFLLALAFCLKLYALAFVPVVALYLLRRESRESVARAAAAFAGVAVAVFGVAFAIAPGGVGFSLKTQLLRGLHVESLAATPLLVGERLGLGDARIVAGDPGSIDLDGTLPEVLGYATSVLQAATIVAAAWLFARGAATDERLVLAYAATGVAVVVPAKVLSPQFLVWLVPLVVLVGGRARAALLALLVLALVATQIEVEGYRGLEPTDWAVAVLAARNVLLVLLLALLLARLAGERAHAVRNS